MSMTSEAALSGLRWLGDDATWAVRSSDLTSPAFPQLHQILKHGDTFDGPQFPALWSAS
jgi:hypothetical protein